MAGDVAGELFAIRGIPAAVTVGFGLQPGSETIASHHAVGFKFQQIFAIQILRALQRPAGKSHSRQRQWPRQIGNRVCDRLTEGRLRGEQKDRQRPEDAPSCTSRVPNS